MAEAPSGTPGPPDGERVGWLTDNVKWIIVTLMIPLVTAIVSFTVKSIEDYRTDQKAQTERTQQALEALRLDARNDVQAMTMLIPELASDNPQRREIAIQVMTRLEDAQHQGSTAGAFFDTIVGNLRRKAGSDNEADRVQAAKDLEVIQKALPSTRQGATEVIARPTAAATAATKPRVVYIQYFTAQQKQQAQAVQDLFRSAGVPVPGLENVSRLAPGTLPGAEIRYFNAADQGSAQWVRDKLGEAGMPGWQVIHARASSSVPSGQIELWWPNSRDR